MRRRAQNEAAQVGGGEAVIDTENVEEHLFGGAGTDGIAAAAPVQEMRQQVQGYESGLALEEFAVGSGLAAYHRTFPLPAAIVAFIAAEEERWRGHLRYA